MRALYMELDDHRRFINHLLDCPLGEILRDQIELITVALGEKAGIWPEYARPDDEEENLSAA